MHFLSAAADHAPAVTCSPVGVIIILYALYAHLVTTNPGNCSEPVLNSYASGDASHPESPDAT